MTKEARNAYMRAYAKTEKRKAYMRAYAKRYRKAHPEKKAAELRAWRAKNLERSREINRNSHARHRAKRASTNRASHMRRTYGLTSVEFGQMVCLQDGVCAICSLPEMLREPSGDRATLSVDHDHSRSGKASIRGLLCRRCNTGIGFFLDDPTRLRNAAEYLEARGRS